MIQCEQCHVKIIEQLDAWVCPDCGWKYGTTPDNPALYNILKPYEEWLGSRTPSQSTKFIRAYIEHKEAHNER